MATFTEKILIVKFTASLGTVGHVDRDQQSYQQQVLLRVGPEVGKFHK